MTDKNITVLENLYRDVLNSVEGYKEAAEIAEEASTKQFLRERQTKREQTLGQLETAIRDIDLNYEINHNTTIAGDTHQGFMKLRAAVTDSYKAVMAEIERGESHLKDEFESACKKDDLNPKVQTLISNIAQQIAADLRTVEGLAEAA